MPYTVVLHPNQCTFIFIKAELIASKTKLKKKKESKRRHVYISPDPWLFMTVVGIEVLFSKFQISPAKLKL